MVKSVLILSPAGVDISYLTQRVRAGLDQWDRVSWREFVSWQEAKRMRREAHATVTITLLSRNANPHDRRNLTHLAGCEVIHELDEHTLKHIMFTIGQCREPVQQIDKGLLTEVINKAALVLRKLVKGEIVASEAMDQLGRQPGQTRPDEEEARIRVSQLLVEANISKTDLATINEVLGAIVRTQFDHERQTVTTGPV